MTTSLSLVAPETPTGNRILDAMPAELRAPLASRMSWVPLTRTNVLFEAETTPDVVHFPVDTVVALVSPLTAGGSVEVATIGNEGIVGMPYALDHGEAAVRAVVRVSGRALRIGVEDLEVQLASLPQLGDHLLHYTDALFNQVAQTAACHRYHSAVERLSRLLLMTQDRVKLEEYPLTQEFMAQMLGARRATVTLAAGMLQAAGLISLNRGRVTILDRAGLEAAACECYASITRGSTVAVRPSGTFMLHASVRLRQLSQDNARLAGRVQELSRRVSGLSLELQKKQKAALIDLDGAT